MRVFWATAAEQDRAEIVDHISQDSPLAAIRMDDLFTQAAARLAENPSLGRPDTIPGTRELIPHESYRLVYEVENDSVWILTLVHTARPWPPWQPSRLRKCPSGLHTRKPSRDSPAILAEIWQMPYVWTMSTMNISLPVALRAFVDEQLSLGGYATRSEYLRELICKDRDCLHLRRLLFAGAASAPATPVDEAKFDRLRDDVRNTAKSGA